ncbi:MAG: hypothetical protein JWM93_3984 [Frankiales bacterium]|nr:hypothetical protein [Frankiales bacterium]
MSHPTSHRVNFHGDKRDLAEPLDGQLMGPSLAGEWFAVDHVAYDPDKDLSTAHLRYATEHDFDRVRAAHQLQAETVARIHRLTGPPAVRQR